MRKLVYVCAQCQKESIIADDISDYNMDKIKELVTKDYGDWRKVSIDFGNIGGKAQVEVCSFECSIAWIDAQRQAQYANWQYSLSLK